MDVHFIGLVEAEAQDGINLLALLEATEASAAAEQDTELVHTVHLEPVD
jgi:hypothetical protein